MKIVVAMPFQTLRRYARIINHRSNDFGDAAGKCSTGIGNSITHGIAESNLDRNFGLFRKTHEVLRKGNTESVDICSCHILKMATGDDSKLQGSRSNGEVLPQHHPSILFQF